MKQRVMCFGTFDIIHPGHIAFLEQSASYGDELYVVISRDDRRKKISGTAPIQSQKDRMTIIGALRCVTQVIAGNKRDILAVIKKIKPHVIALGHDQVYGIAVLEQWMARQKNPPTLVRLPAIKRSRYASSRIKQLICEQHGR